MSRYLAFAISDDLRSKILAAFPPVHDKVICHHVTLAYGKQDVQTILHDNKYANYNLNDQYDITILKGYTSPLVQCVTVWINGESLRPDHRMFHCTVSVDSAHGKPVMSNDIILDNSLCSNIEHLLIHNITGKTKLVLF